jgi:transmembrane sensor
MTTRSTQPVESHVERMDTAMQWLLRLRDDKATDQDVAEWLTWYESDERNTRAFDSMQTFWQQVGQLASGADAAERVARLGSIDLMDINANLPRQVESHWRLRLTPRIEALIRPPAAVGIAASLLLVTGVALFLMQRAGTQNASPAVNDVARVRHTRLPDSSSVDLAANSSVAVEYTAAQRILDLQKGEAFFSVAPNHQRPFIVKASGLHVRAVGTKFNVREADDRVIVTVAEGTVDVYAADANDQRSDLSPTAASGSLRLTAGNEVTWVVGTEKRVVRTTDPERAIAWRYGRLEYIDEPLSAVVADVNRYSSRKLIIDPGVAQLTYTGTVLIGSIEEWLRAMPEEFPIKVIAADSSVTIVPSERMNRTTATQRPQ